MSYLDSIVLGLLQGLTEFLPVSSSGHLVLAQWLMGVKQQGVTFEVIVHLGSLLAVLVYFRVRIFQLLRSIYDPDFVQYRPMLGFLVLGTIPAGLAGVFLKDFFESIFSSPKIAAVMLLVTGLILLSTRFAPKVKRPLTAGRSFLIGIGQAVAILPGISRSGSTIAAGMLLGVKPTEAAEFSFLLAIPAVGGAVLLEFTELLKIESGFIGQYLCGAVFSFMASLAAVYLVLATIRRGKIQYFAYYCFAIGLLGLYLFR
ncbi:MAG: undecaprenyl-diphosphate phosphatase [bacterium]|nr:undecaprenyl-diphosphate phosphatase [bacterium]